MLTKRLCQVRFAIFFSLLRQKSINQRSTTASPFTRSIRLYMTSALRSVVLLWFSNSSVVSRNLLNPRSTLKQCGLDNPFFHCSPSKRLCFASREWETWSPHILHVTGGMVDRIVAFEHKGRGLESSQRRITSLLGSVPLAAVLFLKICIPLFHYQRKKK